MFALIQFFLTSLISKNLTSCNVGFVRAVVVTQPLSKNGGMAEDHGPPETGQLPRTWTKDRRETKSRQRASGAKSQLLESAEWDEGCLKTDFRKHCMKNF